MAPDDEHGCKCPRHAVHNLDKIPVGSILFYFGTIPLSFFRELNGCIDDLGGHDFAERLDLGAVL